MSAGGVPRITLGAALEAEHREIDGGIERFLDTLRQGIPDTEALVRAMEGLRRHIYLEEAFLFPPLNDAGMTMPIFVMLREHGELWRAMNGIDALLGDDLDEDAVGRSAVDLLALLDKHNSKEEPVIYTKADEVLDADASAELRIFLTDGELPDGWVCSGAVA
ncbi:hemerythrin domain-containing protein [Humibacter ginsengiterrae]